MHRVNVYDPETQKLVGWFDIHAAEKFSEDTRAHEALYRTNGGRWVLNCWSNWEFISDDEAKEWLLTQYHDEAAKRYFGPIEEERGPGRPEIGPAIQVRLPEDLLAAVDARADAEGVSRAEMVRMLLAEALGQR